jgi:LacI family transcriptional regulator
MISPAEPIMPRKNPPTIYDVARLAGLSVSTVSRVLNSSERLSEETRVKVLAVIDQLHYIPKAEVRARALQGTRRIGVLTPFFTAPSFVQRLRGIAAALNDPGYELIIYPVHSLKRLNGYLAALPITGSLDGLITLSLPIDEENSRRLADHHLETVLIEYNQDRFSSVEIDDFEGGKQAAQYLMNKGHRQMAFLGDLNPPDYAIQPARSRLSGFRQGLTEANLALPDDYCIASSFDRESSRLAAQQILSLPKRPTAIFASADIQAATVIKVAGELGLKIPRDLAVIGFDDVEMADYLGLTTINQYLDDSGRIAVELLLGRLSDPDRPVQHVSLPLTIVERETT